MTNTSNSSFLKRAAAFALIAFTLGACGSDAPTALSAADFTGASLMTQNTVHLRASTDEVWRFLTEYERLPEYIPGVVAVEVDGTNAEVVGGVGTRRMVTMAQPDGSTVLLQEEVAAFAVERSLGYRVLEGNPFGLRDHFALVDLSADGSETRLTWSQYFDHDNPEAMRETIAGAMDLVASNLADRFGGSLTSR